MCDIVKNENSSRGSQFTLSPSGVTLWLYESCYAVCTTVHSKDDNDHYVITVVDEVLLLFCQVF